MLTVLTGIALALAPFLTITALLGLANHVQRARERAAARQIALTDAVHRELGAVVAPSLHEPLLGPWQVVIPVPFGRADLVGRVLAVVHEALGAIDPEGLRRVRIVLTPQEEGARACS